MSHDIRTPINGIRGMVDICRFNLGNREKEEECLDKIMSASGFLLDLVNDVLDMNKLESGRLPLKKNHLSLRRLLMRSAVLLRHRQMNSVSIIRLTGQYRI